MRSNSFNRSGPALGAIIVSYSLLASAGFAGTRNRPLGAPVIEKSFSETTYDGYRVRASFRLYRPAHADEPPTLPYDHRSSVNCSHGATDAVVPVTFTLTNTSAHASVGLGTDIGLDETTLRNISHLKFDAMLDHRARCITTTAANAALYTNLWNRPSEPGEGERADLFAIVPGYFGPAHPNGDPAYLRTLGLDVFLYANGEVPGHSRFRGTVPPTSWFLHLAK
jgi:hypothetical protein